MGWPLAGTLQPWLRLTGMRPRPAGTAALVTLLVVSMLVTGCRDRSAGSGSAAASTAPVSLTGPVYSDADARARAEVALDRLHLPAGAVRLTVAPADESRFGFLTPGGAQTFITDVRWWQAPGTQQQLAAYEVAHPPIGFTVRSGGGLIDKDVLEAEVEPIPGSGAPEVAIFEINIRPVAGHVEIGVTADVLVTPHRTAVEMIPATVSTATLAYDRYQDVGAQKLVLHRQRVLTRAEVQQLATALNALVPYPGLPECPAVPAYLDEATLTMTYGGHDAKFIIEAGCGGADVFVDGQQQPFLDHDDDVAAMTLTMLAIPPLPS